LVIKILTKVRSPFTRIVRVWRGWISIYEALTPKRGSVDKSTLRCTFLLHFSADRQNYDVKLEGHEAVHLFAHLFMCVWRREAINYFYKAIKYDWQRSMRGRHHDLSLSVKLLYVVVALCEKVMRNVKWTEDWNVHWQSNWELCSTQLFKHLTRHVGLSEVIKKT